MKRRNKLVLILSVITLVLTIILCKPQLIRNVYAKADNIYNEIKIFTEVFMMVRDNYVEPRDTKDLIYGAAKGIVKTLDPFSQFMEPDVNKMMKSEAEGSFGGLGIRIAIRENVLTVITPLPDTPAYRMGILPGDKIVKIEGESTRDITLMQAVKKLRGEKGTKVTISIMREGEKDLIDFTITRDIIKLESVPEHEMIEGNIGYIRLTEFTKRTVGDFSKAMEDLKSRGMNSLILDLRYNPGGLLNVAVEICKMFVGEDKLIVYTKGRKPEHDLKFFAGREAKYSEIPIVVIVNQGSASGSEILAGCIKDWRRGIILGQKTFGKASVQSIIPLSDGSGLRLTTAHYYTPSGVLIHEKGIEPDIEVKVEREYMAKLMKQKERIYVPPGAKEKEEEKEEDKEEEKEELKDIQLERAKEILIVDKILSGPKPKSLSEISIDNEEEEEEGEEE